MNSNNRNEQAKILPPSRRLQEKLGRNVKLDELVTEEVLENAQATVKNSLELFINSTQEELDTLETVASKDLTQEAAGPKTVQQALDPAFSIKSRSGIYGYELASAIARSLYNYMEDLTQLDEHDMKIINAHSKALRGVFANQITGTGDKLGEELMGSLEALINKYQH